MWYLLMVRFSTSLLRSGVDCLMLAANIFLRFRLWFNWNFVLVSDTFDIHFLHFSMSFSTPAEC